MAEGQDRETGQVQTPGPEAALAAIAESSPDTIMLLDLDASIRFINRAAPGLTPDGVVGTSMYDYIDPVQHAAVQKCLDGVTATGRPGSFETLYMDPETSQLMFWESRVSAVRAQDGSVASLAVIASDVTQRRAVEREREQLFAMSLDMLGVASMDGYFKRVSAAFTRVLGYTAEELQARPFIEFVHDKDREATRAALARLAEGEDVVDFENRYLHRDGGYRLLSWRASSDVPTDTVYGVARDITDQRAQERRERQLQKMDAVGRLAGGIAHDFNNLLQVILGSAEMASSRTGVPERVQQHLNHIRTASGRAEDLVKRLLTFSRPAPFRMVPVDLRTLCRSVAQLVTRLLPDDIRLELQLPEASVVVEADPAQLEQVVVNLCVNARDAMPRGGELLLRARTLTGAAGARSLAILEVEDSGTGVEPELREHVFEPFFTTKGPTAGSGLGLSTAYSIVQQLRGKIDVDDSERGGAVFRISLPTCPHPPAEEEVAPPARVDPGSGTVLVAEDEEVVRQVTVAALRDAGYEVHEADNGREALAMMEQHRIDAVVLDMVMPDMSGLETWDHIRVRWPQACAVFVSGYVDPERFRGLAGRHERLLRKPYGNAELLRAVANALDAARAQHLQAPESVDEATRALPEPHSGPPGGTQQRQR